MRVLDRTAMLLSLVDFAFFLSINCIQGQFLLEIDAVTRNLVG